MPLDWPAVNKVPSRSGIHIRIYFTVSFSTRKENAAEKKEEKKLERVRCEGKSSSPEKSISHSFRKNGTSCETGHCIKHASKITDMFHNIYNAIFLKLVI